MNEKISVIVPVYNVEKYLFRCIGSILEQTYTNFELILVNDGSLDSSLEICNKFKEYDSRVKIIDKKNEGVSAARNDGICIASGEYITFIDSDDWISPNYLEKLLTGIENENCDLSVGKIENRGLSCNAASRISKIIDFSICSEIDKVCTLKIQEMSSPCVKLYKTDIINKNQIFFREDMKRLEDYLFVVEYLRYVNKIYISDDAKYYYNRMTTGSLTKQYHANFAEWSVILLEKYKVLLQKHNISDDMIKDELGEMAYRWIIMCIGMYVEKDEILLKMSLSSLVPYLKLSDKWVIRGGELKKINEYILNKDVANIFSIYKRYLSRHRLGNLYVKYKLKICKHYLEKNRDFLKIYKKKFKNI